MKTKVCRTCERRRAVTKFHINREKKDGYAIYCKDCVNEKKRKRYNESPEMRLAA